MTDHRHREKGENLGSNPNTHIKQALYCNKGDTIDISSLTAKYIYACIVFYLIIENSKQFKNLLESP